ncbi:MAG: TIGR03862 family flavoprotein [Ignavibacteria bacterium]
MSSRSVAVIGGGPAGLMAAEVLGAAGIRVDLYDAMPSVGRKFLMAGKGGLNLTHAEPKSDFVSRYGERQAEVARWLAAFDAEALRAWARGRGGETFGGSSGRGFPTGLKAAPLLRSWVRRLHAAGVRFHMRHRWLGWDGGGALRLATPAGEITARSDAVVLALGGASWPKLGSDGAWVQPLEQRGVAVARLRPANCGFEAAWSEHFRGRFAGEPVKSVGLSFCDATGRVHARRGEFVVTANGIEGGAVYALAAPLRDAIEAQGVAVLHIDLLPDHSADRVRAEVAHPRGARSLSSHLKGRLGLGGVKAGLLRECAHEDLADAGRLAAAIKSLPLRLTAPRPLDEAISTAGGVDFAGLDERLMVKNLPGVFCAGEMLDWEAPTGGYLLTACFASGSIAGRGAAAWLAER